MWVKLHKGSRTVVAVCDGNVLGKKFHEGIRVLDVRESFFKGKEYDGAELLSVLKAEFYSGSTFNIVGKKSVNAAIESGIVDKEDVLEIEGIPFIIVIN